MINEIYNDSEFVIIEIITDDTVVTIDMDTVSAVAYRKGTGNSLILGVWTERAVIEIPMNDKKECIELYEGLQSYLIP